MTSKQSTVDFILEQLKSDHDIRARKMFGDYALYCDGKVVGLICDDQLYIKYTDPGKKLAEGRFVKGYAYAGARESMNVSGEVEDRDFLCALVEVTANSLPHPKSKK